MGFPSEQIEGVYRNPMARVAQFLETRHKDHYMVQPVLGALIDPAKFNRRVQAYPFAHNPPPLKLIGEFCENVKAWFDEHPDNVVAVDCKAGKGRTGVMISAQLLHERMYSEADDALAFYGFARTNNCEGVTIPSQRTYVHYYAHLCAEESLRQRLADKSPHAAHAAVALPSSVPRKADKASCACGHPHRDDDAAVARGPDARWPTCSPTSPTTTRPSGPGSRQSTRSAEQACSGEHRGRPSRRSSTRRASRWAQMVRSPSLSWAE